AGACSLAWLCTAKPIEPATAMVAATPTTQRRITRLLVKTISEECMRRQSGNADPEMMFPARRLRCPAFRFWKTIFGNETANGQTEKDGWNGCPEKPQAVPGTRGTACQRRLCLLLDRFQAEHRTRLSGRTLPQRRLGGGVRAADLVIDPELGLGLVIHDADHLVLGVGRGAVDNLDVAHRLGGGAVHGLARPADARPPPCPIPLCAWST